MRSCLGSIVVAALVSGVVAVASRNLSVSPQTATTSTTPIVNAPSARVSLGISVPAAKSDRLFTLTMPGNEVKEQTVALGWRVASLEPRRLRLIGNGSAENASLLAGEGDWKVPLRARSGKPYQDVTFLGMFDATHAALLGRRDELFLLSVSRVGEIRELMSVGEGQNVLRVAYGAAWLSTFRPGEGIESQPQGPSELIKIGFDGVSSTVETNPNVIVSVVPGPGESFAYLTDAGEVTAQSHEELASQVRWKGQGRPLVWLDEHRLLLAKGVTVEVLDMSRAILDRVADLPAAPSAASL